ncbi:hypothetical protein [Citrobacter braakii]|uniref:hypothetical protein n=1 Tax=Citrobacter braakii TaxID=57706 RepID=UPI0019044CEF|nr:hypothetical protein [Citrobacter braakii]EMC3651093.1 hypothetical protein [Citrobacter braakii]MBJ8971009.1 hypothetical protein [Citrobacter braakii]
MENRNIYNRHLFFGLIVVLLISAGAFLIKYNDFKNGRGVENIQATYHALLTINSLSSLPLSESMLLPTVNFNSYMDKNIPWAAAVKTIDGNYVYTSFPSLGFALPYALLRIVGANLNISDLFFVNSLFLFFAIVFFFSSIYLHLIKIGIPSLPSVLASIAGSSVMLFASESLISSGLIYWPQSLSQMLLAIILFIFSARKNNISNLSDFFLFVLLTAFSMTEWTGYVFGACLFFYSSITKHEGWKRICLLCFFSSLLAVLVFFVQITSVLDLNAFFNTSIERFGVRGAAKADFTKLIKGYWISFGLFLVFIIPALYYLRDARHRFIIILCMLPMAENIILASHAISFTFDRWKLAFPIGMAIAITVAELKKISFTVIIIAIGASIFGVHQYNQKVNIYTHWSEANIKNKELAYKASKVTDFRCANIYSDTRVRGYTVMLFKRGVTEGIPKSPKDILHNDPSRCSVVIIRSAMPTPDIPEIHEIEVWNRDESQPHRFN